MPDDPEYPADEYEQRQPKKFTSDHWEHALAGVFARAAVDEGFRLLCLAEPRTAVHAVAPNLELPVDFKFFFATEGRDLIHSYLLPSPLPPPPLCREHDLRRFAKQTLDSYMNNGNNVTCTATPKGTGIFCGLGGEGGDGGDGGDGGNSRT